MGLRTYALSVLVYALTSSNALSAPKLKIAPVELLGYVGKDLKISYELPCGASFYGVVADSTLETLKVGVAFLMKPIRCASMPERHEMVINYLNTTGFKEIRPLKVHQTRIKIVKNRMIDVRTLGPKGQKQVVQMAYEPSCGAPVGTLIQELDESSLGVARLEKMASQQSLTNCPRAQSLKSVKELAIKDGRKLTIIADVKDEIAQSMDIKLVKIKKGSLVRLKRRGVKLTYLRDCNEAPIGVVLKSGKNGSSHIGMLVAKYHNRKCQKPKVWSHYTSKDVYIPKKYKVYALGTMPTKNNLKITAPTAFARFGSKKKAQTGLAMDFLDSCNEMIGAVYASNALSRKVHIGLLMNEREISCKKRMTEVSLFEPFLSKKIKLGQVQPLRIRGFAAH